MENSTQQAEHVWKTNPGRQHQWLQKLVGDWTYEGEVEAGPDSPSEKIEGTMHVRRLGALWILCEGSGETADGEAADSLITLGFDPEPGRFVGTFVSSMMGRLWVYDGWLDPEERVLTLESEGPDLAGTGGTAPYRDVIEVVSDGHFVFRSLTQDEAGTWQPFMTAHYRRKQGGGG